jgi:hypothetical protein
MNYKIPPEWRYGAHEVRTTAYRCPTCGALLVAGVSRGFDERVTRRRSCAACEQKMSSHERWGERLGDARLGLRDPGESKDDKVPVSITDVVFAMKISRRARRMGSTHSGVCRCWMDRGLCDALAFNLAGDP